MLPRGMRRLRSLCRQSPRRHKQHEASLRSHVARTAKTKRKAAFNARSLVSAVKSAFDDTDKVGDGQYDLGVFNPGYNSADQAPQTDEERLAAREAVKRSLPRYARINTLLPGMTWAHLQRELQKSGFMLWRPSLREKRAATNAAVGPEPPKNTGGKLYYRDPHVEDMLVFCPMGQSRTAHVPLFESGSLIFQQKASAFPALALAPPRGACVIDSCAAPGSKTSQMATLMQNEGQIFAFDRDERRLNTLTELMDKRKVSIVEPCQQDFLKTSPTAPKFAKVTHFLLDPSCSSSGMTTQPYSDSESMIALVKNQVAIVRHAMRFPACQRVAYSTCSIYEQENEGVVESVLRSPEGAEFQLVEALPWWPRRGLPVIPNGHFCVRTLMDDKTIGFFVAVFQRKS